MGYSVEKPVDNRCISPYFDTMGVREAVFSQYRFVE